MGSVFDNFLGLRFKAQMHAFVPIFPKSFYLCSENSSQCKRETQRNQGKISSFQNSALYICLLCRVEVLEEIGSSFPIKFICPNISLYIKWIHYIPPHPMWSSAVLNVKQSEKNRLQCICIITIVFLNLHSYGIHFTTPISQ